MTTIKQIKASFWQNDFVTELTPEERYFYMYLITNTMTTQCGIYKFNMKLAELETGLTCEVIEKHLKNFESSGKIKISRTSKEIMIMNWFKHNFKGGKAAVLSINKELRDVKDKEFLRQLYDFCVGREYPVDEIFKGVLLVGLKKNENIKQEEENNVNTNNEDDKCEVVKNAENDLDKSQAEVLHMETSHQVPLQDETYEQTIEPKDLILVKPKPLSENYPEKEGCSVETPKEEADPLAEPLKPLFMGFKDTCDDTCEEMIIEGIDILDDEQDDGVEGTTRAFWNFDEAGGIISGEDYRT